MKDKFDALDALLMFLEVPYNMFCKNCKALLCFFIQIFRIFFAIYYFIFSFTFSATL